MNFQFDFESKEMIDDNFFVTMKISPFNSKMYQYKLIFHDGTNNVEYGGITSNPITSLVKLRNILTSTIDTLHDCIDITKMAASQIDTATTEGFDVFFKLLDEKNEEDNEDDNEDEDENDKA